MTSHHQTLAYTLADNIHAILQEVVQLCTASYYLTGVNESPQRYIPKRLCQNGYASMTPTTLLWPRSSRSFIHLTTWNMFSQDDEEKKKNRRKLKACNGHGFHVSHTHLTNQPILFSSWLYKLGGLTRHPLNGQASPLPLISLQSVQCQRLVIHLS